MSDRHDDDEQERKLFVGGLNKASTDEDILKNYFQAYGNVIDSTIMRDQDKQSRGFGFVLFEDASSVDKIMSAKRDGSEDFLLGGHHVKIKRALPKVPGGNAGSSRSDDLHRKIFVGGLPSNITEQELRQYFEQYGHVNEIELLRDRETNHLRGFAFVTFDDEDIAHKCIQRKYHEICKKTCDVRRAQTKSNHGGREENGQGRRSGGYNNRESRQQINSFDGGAPAAVSTNINMSQVNQLIQQAFMMGQQSLQAPTAATLLNGAGTAAQPSTNVLLQALMNRQPVAAPPPVAPVPFVDSSNTAALTQLTQILQNRRIDVNALGALLQGDSQPAATPAADKTATGYSTAYQSATPYNYSYDNTTSSSYRGSKDDDKRRYNPY